MPWKTNFEAAFAGECNIYQQVLLYCGTAARRERRSCSHYWDTWFLNILYHSFIELFPSFFLRLPNTGWLISCHSNYKFFKFFFGGALNSFLLLHPYRSSQKYLLIGLSHNSDCNKDQCTVHSSLWFFVIIYEIRTLRRLFVDWIRF